jgi:hypothetical protein
MFRANDPLTIAALIAGAGMLSSASIATVDSSEPKAAPKGDRLEVRVRSNACSGHVWPNYDGACLDDPRKIRIVSVDRPPPEPNLK